MFAIPLVLEKRFIFCDRTATDRGKTKDKTQKMHKDRSRGFIAIDNYSETLKRCCEKYISASGGLFSDRSYSLLKKMQKRRR